MKHSSSSCFISCHFVIVVVLQIKQKEHHADQSLCSSQMLQSVTNNRCKNIIMILTTAIDFKADYQISYNNSISELQIHQISCPCCHHHNLCWHGCYKRKVFTNSNGGDKVTLKVSRLKCQFCKATHALLPQNLVPYQQIPLAIQVDVIAQSATHSTEEILSSNICLDECNVKSIIARFRLHWVERLRCESLDLSPIPMLIQSCISIYRKQFMQIRGIPLSTFLIPT